MVADLAPGATGSITITADVDPALALGAQLTDSATIASNAAGFVDPNPTDNTAELTSTVEANNDVAVTVTADQDEVTAGAHASFTVVVTNNGPQLASKVVLTNALPPELVASTLIVPPGCVVAGTTATCDLGDVAVGVSRTFVFGGTVAADVPTGTTIVHTATVTFDGTDAVESNNTSADTILVVAQPAPTTTSPPGTTTTTLQSGSGSGGGGTLPFVGVAVVGLLVLALVFIGSGGSLRAIAAWPRSRRR